MSLSESDLRRLMKAAKKQLQLEIEEQDQMLEEMWESRWQEEATA